MSRQQGQERTAERRPSGWQRGLRWAAWLVFLGLAVLNSQRISFGAVEFLALAVAIGVSIWCLAKPLGGPKVAVTEPSQLRGAFESRTSWGLVLLGAVLTVGGIGAGGAIVYDLATGRATVGDVLRDMAIFVEGWFVEVFTKGAVDSELEKTHAYALAVLLPIGLLVLLLNLRPFLHRGVRWRVEPDGSVAVRAGNGWTPLLEYQFAQVTADGTTITFTPPAGHAPLVLPQLRVFSVEFDARIRAALSAEFFRNRLIASGFSVEPSDSGANSFEARRHS